MIAAMRTVVRNRNLVRLFTGEFISNIGDWLYLVALLVVVYRTSNDPVVLGIIGGARIIPYVLLSVPAGIVVDRFDRRMVLIVTDAIRGLAMIVLAANTFMGGPVGVTVAVAIFATCFAVFFRPAMGAYLPSLVRNETELGPANSVYATLSEITFVLGPAIAGVIIAVMDPGWAFVLNAFSFLAPVLILWGLPPNNPRAAKAAGEASAVADVPEDAGASADADVPASAAPAPAPEPTVTVRDIIRPVSGLALMEVVAGFFWGGLSVALVIFAVDQLKVTDDATGFLWAAVGVGGVLGAIASTSLVLRPNLALPLVIGTAILVAGFIMLGFVDTMLLASVALIIIAGGALIEEVVRETVLQRVVPDAIRGRTFGAMQTVSTLTYALGSFAVPILFTTIGAQAVLVTGGILIGLSAVGALLLAGPSFRRSAEVEAAATVLARVAKLPLFAGVSSAALEVAAARLVPVPVAAGEVVIREGDPADRFYIIESGTFVVDQLDAGTGLQRRLRTMKADEVFGELGLMHGAPRSATVTAEGAGRLLALDGPDFLELLNAGPEISGRMLERYRDAGRPLG
jgi:MFS family permease